MKCYGLTFFLLAATLLCVLSNETLAQRRPRKTPKTSSPQMPTRAPSTVTEKQDDSSSQQVEFTIVPITLKQKELVDEAIKSMERAQLIYSLGSNYSGFNTSVSNAHSSVQAAVNSLPESDLRKLLVASMQALQDLDFLWGYFIGRFHDPRYPPQERINRIIKDYNLQNMSQAEALARMASIHLRILSYIEPLAARSYKKYTAGCN